MRHGYLVFFVLAFSLCSVCSLFALNVKEVTFTTKDAGKVIFNHNFHIRQKGISNNCNTCHNSIFSMKKTIRYTMKQMHQGKSCGTCHNGTVAFGLDDCAKCHKAGEVIFKVKETGPVRFSHKIHTRTGPCSGCHNKPYAAGPNKRVGMAQMEKGKSCGSCHDGREAFGIGRCTKCHPVKEVFFASDKAGPVRFSHKSHLNMYKCGECHAKLYAAGRNKRVGMAQMEKGASCGSCHEGKTAFSVGDCAMCHPVREIEFQEKTAGNVTFSHKLHLGMYKCGDCHPALYLPAKSKGGVTMVEMYKGKSCGACHDGNTAFGARGECDRCHKS